MGDENYHEHKTDHKKRFPAKPVNLTIWPWYAITPDSKAGYRHR